MAHSKPAFKINKTYATCLHGWHIPYKCAYGTFTGYKNPIQWVAPTFPRTKQSTFSLYIWTGKSWVKAIYNRFKKLYDFVVQEIASRNLLGVATTPTNASLRGTFQSSAPYGRPNKTTSLKQANNKYLSRADDRDLKWSRQKDGWIDKIPTKNIIY